MCKYCENIPNNQPLAFNKAPCNPLVEIATCESSPYPVLRVNYDEEEPLHISIKFCPMCGRTLDKPVNP